MSNNNFKFVQINMKQLLYLVHGNIDSFGEFAF